MPSAPTTLSPTDLSVPTITVYQPSLDREPVPAVRLAPRAALPDGATLGLVDNGKPGARRVLSLLAERLADLLPITGTELISKSSAANPMDAAVADALAARVDVVLTGLGDCGACSAGSLQDALLMEARGIPATVLITDVFIAHVARFADNLGAPGYHTLVAPHPLATKDEAFVRRLAADLAGSARAQLVEPGA